MSASWRSVREVGSVFGIRILVALSRVFGRTLPRLVLYVVALYYLVFHGAARRASRDYLRRAGKPAGGVAVYRHLLRFAQCTLDRLFFLRGELHHFEIHRTGREHLAALRDSGTGAILLGAHLGAFEAMRAVSAGEELKLNVVGYFHNAAMINRFLDAAGDNSRTRFIDLGGSSVDTALRIQKLIQGGELVAILGDRAGEGPSVRVPFFGALAEVPTGAFALASVLGCPVYLTFALHTPPNRYDLFCEPFLDRVEGGRQRREEVLTRCAEQYARRLEHYCRLRPDNWFNFYDFWGDSRIGHGA